MSMWMSMQRMIKNKHMNQKKVKKCNNYTMSSSRIAQLVEHKISNLRVASSTPALCIGRNGPLVHPTATWVPGTGTRLVSWLFNWHL